MSKPRKGLTSDGGCRGNPGPAEYQVTDILGNVLKHHHLGTKTNNYAELAGIAGMIRLAIEIKENILWTDSQVCLFWIEKWKKGNKKLGKKVKNKEKIMRKLDKIVDMLNQNPHLTLKKWDTKNWGEIPADFQRK